MPRQQKIDNEIKDLIVSAYEDVTKLTDDRTNINDKVKEVRSRLRARGIHPKAFDMVVQYLKLDEPKRAGFDLAYQTIRQTLGVPVDPQGDFEDYIEQDEEDEENDE